MLWAVPEDKIPLRKVVVGVVVVDVVKPPIVFDVDDEPVAEGLLVVCNCDGDDAAPAVVVVLKGTVRLRRRSGTDTGNGGFEAELGLGLDKRAFSGECVDVVVGSMVVIGCEDDDDDDDGLPIDTISADGVDVDFPRGGLFNVAAVDADASGSKEPDDGIATIGLLCDNGEVTTVVSDS